jgi:hypothetical protein
MQEGFVALKGSVPEGSLLKVSKHTFKGFITAIISQLRTNAGGAT